MRNPNQFVKLCPTCGERHDLRLPCRTPKPCTPAELEVLAAARALVSCEHPDLGGMDIPAWGRLVEAVGVMDGWKYEWSETERCVLAVPR